MKKKQAAKAAGGDTGRLLEARDGAIVTLALDVVQRPEERRRA